MRLVIAGALALLLAGCAKIDMDECRKGDRSRCPGDASTYHHAPTVASSVGVAPSSSDGSATAAAARLSASRRAMQP